MYRVVRRFKDLKHGGHIYKEGDQYPVEGRKTTKKRLEQLAEGKNKYKQVYIEKVDEGDPEDPQQESQPENSEDTQPEDASNEE